MWAGLEKKETAVIFVATICLGFYAGWGERLAAHVFSFIDPPTIQRVWPFVDAIVVTAVCLGCLALYRRWKVRCYPATFLYAFNLPEASNPSGKSQVVGYCHVLRNLQSGEITGEGASFFWENGLATERTRTRFTAKIIYGTRVGDRVICNVPFQIHEHDRQKRNYTHGSLEFEPTHAFGNEYAGYLEGYLRQPETELGMQYIVLRGKGYAEWFSRGNAEEADILTTLNGNGDLLFTKLRRLYTKPHPKLWSEKDRPTKVNCWGITVPSPQEALLDPRIQPFIQEYLHNVLRAFGLRTEAIVRFQETAVQCADQEDIVTAYESELKKALTNQTNEGSEGRALNHRASIIYNEIRGFFVGASLLDIGCGNGLVSFLAKNHFREHLLVDVVDYKPPTVDLPFRLYKEGYSLLVDKAFDTVFLLTVLHHSTNPLQLLENAWRVTGRRLIVIESVIGIKVVPQGIKYNLSDADDRAQVAYAAFVDWFYNRVLHDGVPVPYNFTSVEEWERTFRENDMPLLQTIHLGQDIDIGPEYHVLFVLEKAGSAGIQKEPSSQ
jgi:SAM-dependent methyltransferase